jgi:serine/threonine protein kinase/Tfp pilus assembly protein PilF
MMDDTPGKSDTSLESHRNKSPGPPAHPAQIGPYKILQVLGEGGMGIVYEAEQTIPVTRRVALKVIKVGMDTKDVVARFEAERQALAVMDHPGIAKVYDAGTTETGRPYFAMERVPGIPLHDYCDNKELATEERLRLFIAVCRAVQHAHQKGVIHRDLKPSNILVAEHDGQPIPKVIDFGIAKATGRRLTERTLVTEYGQAIGTPAYMSPEQAEMSGLDVDTRSDVYSLGAILYELLVGSVPVDPEELGYPAFLAGLVLREADFVTPSARVSGLGQQRGIVAKRRRTDPRGLLRQLRGDLDWITMKALEHDRVHRYGTASELAMDIERHLNNEPVLARKPSARDRLRKFVRRHRAGVGFAAALIVLLVGSSITLAMSRNQALHAEAEAKIEAEKAAAVNEFLQRMLGSPNPWTGAREVKVADVLDQATEEVESSFQGQPEVAAAVRFTLGRTYRGLGLYPEAEAQLREALELRRAALPDGDPDIAESVNELGVLMLTAGAYDSAEVLFREALQMRVTRFGTEHISVAESMNNVASALMNQGRLAAADSLYSQALAIRRRLLGEESWEVAEILNNIGLLKFRLGEFAAADTLFRAALAIDRSTLGDHVDVAAIMEHLAITLNRLERHAEAEQLYRDALDITRRLLGDDHPSVARSINNLAVFLWRAGRLEEAEPLIREALAINRRALGEEHPSVASNLNNLALVLRDRQDYDEAEVMFRAAIEIDRRLLGDTHPNVASDLNNLGGLLTRARKYRQAELVLREARQIQLSTFDEASWQVATTESLLADALNRAGRYAEAEPIAVRAYEIIRAEFGDGHGRTRAALGRVIAAYEGLGQPEKVREFRAMLR